MRNIKMLDYCSSPLAEVSDFVGILLKAPAANWEAIVLLLNSKVAVVTGGAQGIGHCPADGNTRR